MVKDSSIGFLLAGFGIIIILLYYTLLILGTTQISKTIIIVQEQPLQVIKETIHINTTNIIIPTPSRNEICIQSVNQKYRKCYTKK